MKLSTETSKSLALLILSICIVICFFWIRSLYGKQKFSDELIKELKYATTEKVEIPESTILKDLVTNQTFIKTEIIPKITPEKSLPAPLVRYYEDTVKAAILKLSNDQREIEIKEYTKLIGTLKGELNSKNSLITKLQDSTLQWKNDFITINSDFKNQISTYKYDADLDFVVTRESGKEYFYATSKDSSFTFNQSNTFKKEIPKIKKNIDLSIDNSINYGFGPTSSRILTNWRPFYVASGLKLIYNPDGFLRPYMGAYYWLDINSYQSFYMGTVGLDIKIFKK